MADVPELFPDLGPEDEQFVRDILQPRQPDGPVPPAVAARWQDQIAQLHDEAASTPERRTRPQLRLAGAVASIAALALLAGVVLNSVSSTTTSPTVASGEAATPSTQNSVAGPLPIAQTVTTSGLQYTPGAIRKQLQTLISQRQNKSAVAGSDPLATSLVQPTPETSMGTSASVLDPASQQFIADEIARAKCFVEITGSDARSPVLLDIGQFSSEPAALIAFATQANNQQLDIWVVRPSCTTGEPEILWFGRIQRP
jgi:hypothetical protein